MKRTILVIDDDPSLRRVMEFNLQEAGYAVITAVSGEEGLAAFAGFTPDLVVTDVKMGRMDGLQVLKEIKKRSYSTPVVIVTAFGAVGAAVEAMKLGAYDYLTKPFKRDELCLIVAKALQMTERAVADVPPIHDDLADRIGFQNIIGTSREMTMVFDTIRRVAGTEATVLVTGESGTGKELVARAIHDLSGRCQGQFVAINCAAIPRDLLESELFGHVKGAFTGAIKDKPGKFQQADGGTLFLDEIGELPLELQPKLLRALQERVVEPVGGDAPRRLDVRVVAATNVDLEKVIAKGGFREDLYYRLSVIPLHLPPLRERKKDILLLVRHFARKFGGADVEFSRNALDVLMMYTWPGNVRELENTVERLLIMRTGDTVTVEDLPDKVRGDRRPMQKEVVTLPDEGYSLEQLERDAVVQALERNNWNQTAAARFLRVPRHTLVYRMEKYAIIPPAKSEKYFHDKSKVN
ncbi:sigma-54 dependent transcriptional regulator [Geobacter sp.]|uniref:sigma-54-dependent transcriptional regulator n=1 Tax=Geobacter sp. TaxID=46610 RepID=UPI0027B88447|nr:sigma-54 dependent transcriptional regulator [Geobacter sp.]